MNDFNSAFQDLEEAAGWDNKTMPGITRRLVAFQH
jgi:hypothetical protein